MQSVYPQPLLDEDIEAIFKGLTTSHQPLAGARSLLPTPALFPMGHC